MNEIKTNVCIVGHGPSLKGSKRGIEIDSFDNVVRLKQGWKQCRENPEDYGTKTDYLITSTETLGCFEGSQGTCVGYWAYPKYGWYDESRVSSMEWILSSMSIDKKKFHIFGNFSSHKIQIPLNTINKWNWDFSRTAKHPNVSLGMASILYARYFLHPKEIALAGFDTLLNPYTEFTRNSDIPRTGFGDYPNHDWFEENKLLQYLQQRENIYAIETRVIEEGHFPEYRNRNEVRQT